MTQPLDQRSAIANPERPSDPGSDHQSRSGAADIAPEHGLLRRQLDPKILVCALGSLLAVAGALRLYGLDSQSMWLDEAGRVAIAHLPPESIPGGVSVLELSPPLYHLLLRAWMVVAGDSDFGIRLLSALLGLAAVPLAYIVGSRFAGPRVGLVTCGFVAFSPFLVYYSQEAAMYSLLAALVGTNLTFYLGLLSQWRLLPDLPDDGARRSTDTEQGLGQESRWRKEGIWLLGHGISAALALYTHYYFLFMLVGQWLYLAVALSKQPESKRPWLGWCASQGIVALTMVPWLPVMLRQAGLATSVAEWVPVNPLEAGMGLLALLTGGAGGAVPTSLAAWAGLALGAFGAARCLRQRRLTVWACLAVVPFALAVVAGYPLHSFRERGLIGVTYLWYGLLAMGVPLTWTRGQEPRARLLGHRLAAFVPAASAWLLTLLLVFIMGWGIIANYFPGGKEEWRDAASLVGAKGGANEVVLFLHYGGQLAFQRYYRGHARLLGVPSSFSWDTGYYSRYWYLPQDAESVVAPALADRARAWLVLSHDQGRGGEELLSYLRQRYFLLEAHGLLGVRLYLFDLSRESRVESREPGF